MGGGRFCSFELEVGESDLWIGFDTSSAKRLSIPEVQTELGHVVRKLRNEIIAYSERYPEFLTTHKPIQAINFESQAGIPEVIKSMLTAGIAADVGPMAAVAGAIAQEVGRYCDKRWGVSEIVVENGGDLYVDVTAPLSVQVVAPASPLSGKVAVVVPPRICPVGVCTSSATTGHSHSYGKADAVMIACKDAAYADAWATAWCNQVQSPSDIQGICERIQQVNDIISAVVVIADKVGLCGSLEVCAV